MVRVFRLPTDLLTASLAIKLRLLGRPRLLGRIGLSVRLGLLVLALVCSLGCQNRPGNWRLLNFGRVDRVPPPPTGSLNIPQFGPVMGAPTGASLGPGMPPSSMPMGSALPANGFTPSTNPSAAGVNPAAASPFGVSPWNSGASTGNTAPTYTQIPERAASPSAVAANPSPGLDARNAPPLLPGGFDPYSTSTIPSFATPAGGVNPLTTTSSPTVPPGAQDGFWPAPATGTPGSVANNSRSAPPPGQTGQSWFDPSRFQPVNMGGFTTTAPIDNPMIAVTPGAYAVAGAGYYAAPAPGSAPVANANGSFAQQWQSQAANQQVQQAQQMAAWQQAQRNGQSFVAPPVANPGMSNYQVLGENSSSRTAENQARMGWQGAAPPPSNNGYGTAPAAMAGSPAAGLSTGQAPPMFSAAGQPLAAPTAAGPGSGWQTGGAR